MKELERVVIVNKVDCSPVFSMIKNDDGSYTVNHISERYDAAIERITKKKTERFAVKVGTEL